MDGVNPREVPFHALADATGDAFAAAPARLKSRIFSALVHQAQAEAPLCTLSASKSAGAKLCVFEELVAILPGETQERKNPCNVCHARVLAERFENPPIYWPGCPYVRFQNR